MRPQGEPLARDLIATLRGTRLWRDAPENAVRAAAALMQPRPFSEGDVLIRQGRAGTHLHVVVSGRVDVQVRTDGDGGGGGGASVAQLGAGECVGEMSLLTGDPASADVVALTEGETLTLDAESFRSVVAADPVLLRQFVQILSRRLTETDVAVSVSEGEKEALAQFLHERAEWDDDLVGKSSAVRKLRKDIAETAAADAPVLVQGEDGTGREFVARLVHAQSPRSDALVLAVDCAQIADTEFGDKLFGARGAAVRNGGRLAYLSVAAGGTLILRELEKLPLGVQARLGEYIAAHAADESPETPDVRVVATCRAEVSALADAGQVAPALAAALSPYVLPVPALRERKRDIPLLAEHYLKKHAARLDKPVSSLDDQAVTELVSYDYRIGNDRELEQAVERAVILAEGETITAEEVFLGPPPAARTGGVNLLRLPGVNLRRLLVALPPIGRVFGAVFFAGLIALCFLGPSDAAGNVATQIVWTLWWPVLVLSFFFLGRAWCAVCPMGFAGTLSHRWRESRRRIPAWLKKHDVTIAMSGLFLIVFVEETSAMRNSPLLTGLLLVAILAGAVGVGLVYPRRTWCRHVCPLGGMAGVCATSGLIELRPSFDICSAKCVGHACFKGDEHVAGCPMFNHVMFVDTNQHCLLCMQCVASCPNDSPQLNLRLPGRELWSGAACTPEFGLFVLLLAGLLTPMAVVQYLEAAGTAASHVLVEDFRVPFVGGLLVLGAAAPLLFARFAGRSLARRGDAERTTRFWRRVAALAPLVTAGFVAYELAYAPGLAWLNASIEYGAESGRAAPWITLSVLSIVRFGILSAGLLTTTVILWRIDLGTKEERWTARVRRDATLLGVILSYWALLLVLMLAA